MSSTVEGSRLTKLGIPSGFLTIGDKNPKNWKAMEAPFLKRSSTSSTGVGSCVGTGAGSFVGTGAGSFVGTGIGSCVGTGIGSCVGTGVGSRVGLVSRKVPGGSLPDRWLDFLPYKDLMVLPPIRLGDKKIGMDVEDCAQPLMEASDCSLVGILTCKTFLDSRFDSRLSRDQCFSYTDIENRMRKQLSTSEIVQPKLKDVSRIVAVINLCLTERHYDGFGLRQQGIEFYWFRVEGGGEIPNDKTLARFFRLLQYIGLRHPGGIVTLHCTHGVNRTGFFVCAFLMAAYGVSFDEAHELFKLCRGHSMYRTELIAYLKQFHNRLITNDEDVADLLKASLKIPLVSQDIRDRSFAMLTPSIAEAYINGAFRKDFNLDDCTINNANTPKDDKNLGISKRKQEELVKSDDQSHFSGDQIPFNTCNTRVSIQNLNSDMINSKGNDRNLLCNAQNYKDTEQSATSKNSKTFTNNSLTNNMLDNGTQDIVDNPNCNPFLTAYMEVIEPKTYSNLEYSNMEGIMPKTRESDDNILRTVDNEPYKIIQRSELIDISNLNISISKKDDIHLPEIIIVDGILLIGPICNILISPEDLFIYLLKYDIFISNVEVVIGNDIEKIIKYPEAPSSYSTTENVKNFKQNPSEFKNAFNSSDIEYSSQLTMHKDAGAHDITLRQMNDSSHTTNFGGHLPDPEHVSSVRDGIHPFSNNDFPCSGKSINTTFNKDAVALNSLEVDCDKNTLISQQGNSTLEIKTSFQDHDRNSNSSHEHHVNRLLYNWIAKVQLAEVESYRKLLAMKSLCIKNSNLQIFPSCMFLSMLDLAKKADIACRESYLISDAYGGTSNRHYGPDDLKGGRTLDYPHSMA